MNQNMEAVPRGLGFAHNDQDALGSFRASPQLSSRAFASQRYHSASLPLNESQGALDEEEMVANSKLYGSFSAGELDFTYSGESFDEPYSSTSPAMTPSPRSVHSLSEHELPVLPGAQAGQEAPPTTPRHRRLHSAPSPSVSLGQAVQSAFAAPDFVAKFDLEKPGTKKRSRKPQCLSASLKPRAKKTGTLPAFSAPSAAESRPASPQEEKLTKEDEAEDDDSMKIEPVALLAQQSSQSSEKSDKDDEDDFEEAADEEAKVKKPPRKRSRTGTPRDISAKSAQITLADIMPHFALPIRDAAMKLDLCTTLLKQLCRKLGVKRWPQRKMAALDRKIQTIETRLAKPGVNEAERFKLEREISLCQDEKNQVIANATVNMPPSRSTHRNHKNASDDMDADYIEYDFEEDLPAFSNGHMAMVGDAMDMDAVRPYYHENTFHPHDFFRNPDEPLDEIAYADFFDDMVSS